MHHVTAGSESGTQSADSQTFADVIVLSHHVTLEHLLLMIPLGTWTPQNQDRWDWTGGVYLVTYNSL